MAVVYSIRDWERHFEVAQSRKVDGPLSWVALPCKHDGKTFRRIMLLPDGPEIYGAWVLLVQVAAKCSPRGVLRDADGPLTAADLALKTGCRSDVIDKALNVLSGKDIGWLLVAGWEPSGSTLPLQDRTGQTGQTGQEDCSEPGSRASLPSPRGVLRDADGEPAKVAAGPPVLPSEVAFPEFPCVAGRRQGPTVWLLTDTFVSELASAFPAVDVRSECRRAYGWVKANLPKRKTADGMKSFLFNWMSREQNRGGRDRMSSSRVSTAEDEANWNAIDGGLGT